MTTTASRARTTGIGSLPHHNIDAALELSFGTDLPFLPQIPIRNPWEFMIPQALEGMPGLRIEADGGAVLDVDIWASRAHEYGKRLNAAFAPNAGANAFEAFEPSSAISSSWSPFVWECTERGVKRAKIQLAGPVTCQFALKLSSRLPQAQAQSKGQSNVAAPADLSAQLLRHVWARGVAMIRRLKTESITPLIFLDEPGLYALNVGRESGSAQAGTAEALGLQELGLLVQGFRREGAEVGIHCCSDTAWDQLLAMRPDYLSIDVALSLDHLLARASSAKLEAFLKSGGRLSLGIIPTSGKLPTAAAAWETLNASLSKVLSAELTKLVLTTSLYTPACGFALQTTSEAESAFDALAEFETLVSAKLGEPARSSRGESSPR